MTGFTHTPLTQLTSSQDTGAYKASTVYGNMERKTEEGELKGECGRDGRRKPGRESNRESGRGEKKT